MTAPIVIKIGGVASTQLDQAFIQQLQTWQAQGQPLVLVHGGGFAITEALEAAGLDTTKVNGQRVTPKDHLPLIEGALLERVGVSIKDSLRQAGLPVIQLGSDLEEVVQADYLDQDLYGYVGQVSQIETVWLETLMNQGNIPLLASLGYTSKGQLLNVNADYLATAVAVALGAQELILMTDVPGVLKDGAVLPQLLTSQVAAAIADGVITGGMIPKIESAQKTAESGVAAVRIGDQLTGGTLIKKG